MAAAAVTITEFFKWLIMYAVGGQGWTAIIHFVGVLMIANIGSRFFRFVYVEGAKAPKAKDKDKKEKE